MGTRADFYVGRGIDAEWLGSIAWDGYPEGIVPKTLDWGKGESLLDSDTREKFLLRLETYFTDRDDVTRPKDGWPWPWDNSKTSDFAYCFDAGKVWFYGYAKADEDQRRPCWVSLQGGVEFLDFITKEEYPDMRERKNVQFGKRSGLIILGG